MIKNFLTVFVFYIVFSFSLFAGLDDFSDSVDREKDREKSGNSSSSYSDESGATADCLSPICSMIFAQMIKEWYDYNYLVFYSKYPYSDSQYYIAFYGQMSERWIYNKIKNDIESEENEKYTQSMDYSKNNSKSYDLGYEKRKKYNMHHFYFNLEGYYSYVFDTDYTIGTAFSGKIKRFWGPELECRYITDDDQYLSYVAAGINIAIFQNDYFSSDFYTQYIRMDGVTNLQGGSAGFFIRSFPRKPFSYSMRTGMQFYENDIKFYDLEIRAGVHFFRIETFIGYRHLGSDFGAYLTGPLCGVKVWI